jgi:hypothetical protein
MIKNIKNKATQKKPKSTHKYNSKSDSEFRSGLELFCNAKLNENLLKFCYEC